MQPSVRKWIYCITYQSKNHSHYPHISYIVCMFHVRFLWTNCVYIKYKKYLFWVQFKFSWEVWRQAGDVMMCLVHYLIQSSIYPSPAITCSVFSVNGGAVAVDELAPSSCIIHLRKTQAHIYCFLTPSRVNAYYQCQICIVYCSLRVIVLDVTTMIYRLQVIRM